MHEINLSILFIFGFELLYIGLYSFRPKYEDGYNGAKYGTYPVYYEVLNKGMALTTQFQGCC